MTTNDKQAMMVGQYLKQVDPDGYDRLKKDGAFTNVKGAGEFIRESDPEMFDWVCGFTRSVCDL